MCTLTWTRDRGEATGPGGYRLWFNRDELRSRGPEVPPQVEETASGLRYIAPADSDAGGTWIATNELGITVALLNGYRSSRGERRDEWTSRGHLVRELAGIRSLTEAWRRLTPERLRPFRPLVLAVLTPARPALIARWDGQDVTLDPRGQRQLPVTSSSYEQSEVRVRRRALFAEMVRTDPGTGEPVDASELEAFQRWIPEGGADAFSPSMSRADSATRSQCQVEVTPSVVTFGYTPGPPHEADPIAPLQLPRRPASPA